MSHRERDGDYDRVIAQLGPKWRVIECKDAFQWIVQEVSGTQWRNRAYCTSRDGLIRRCGPGLGNAALPSPPKRDTGLEQGGLRGWEVLRQLPARFAAGITVPANPIEEK